MTDKEKVEAILKILETELPDADLQNKRTCRAILDDLHLSLDEWWLV